MGNKQVEAVIMDDLAEIVDGLQAWEVLDRWLVVLCDKQKVSQADTNTLSRELRRVRNGLVAGRGRRLEELERLEER